MGVVSPIKDW